MGNDLQKQLKSNSNMWQEAAEDFDSTWEDDPDETSETPDLKLYQPKAYRNSRAAEDMQIYRHKCRKTVETEYTTDGDEDDDDDYYNNSEHLGNDDLQNVLFYKNLRSSDPDDVTIGEFHDNWKGDYERLEYVHSYIQWLFPIQEAGMNGRAFVLKPKEIKLFRKQQDLKERLLNSYKLMLDFYGIELADEKTGKVQRAKNYEERFRNLDRFTHNNLRITRILKCLGLLGFKHFQAPLVEFFLQETLVNGTLPRVKQSVLDYFLFAVLDSNERKRLIRFAFEHFKPREKFVWCPARIQMKLEKELNLKPYKAKSQDQFKDKSEEGTATNDFEMINTKLFSCSINDKENKFDQQASMHFEINLSDEATESEQMIKQKTYKVKPKETPLVHPTSHHVTQDTNSKTSGDIEDATIINIPPDLRSLNESGLTRIQPVNWQDDPENGTKEKTSDFNSEDQNAEDKTTTLDTVTEQKHQIDPKTSTMVIKTNTDEDSRSTEGAPEAHGSAENSKNPTSDNEATNEIMKTKKRSSSELENEEPKAKHCLMSSEERSIPCLDGNHDSNSVSDVSGTTVQQEGSEKNPNDYKPADTTPGSDNKQETPSQDNKGHESQSRTKDNLTEREPSADPNTLVPQHQSGCGSEIENKKSESVDGNKQNKSPEETSIQHDVKKNDIDTVSDDSCGEVHPECSKKSPKGNKSDEVKIQETDRNSANNATKADTKVHPDPQQTEGSQDKSPHNDSGTKAPGGAVGKDTETKTKLKEKEEEMSQCSDTADETDNSTQNTETSESTQL